VLRPGLVNHGAESAGEDTDEPVDGFRVSGGAGGVGLAYRERPQTRISHNVSECFPELVPGWSGVPAVSVLCNGASVKSNATHLKGRASTQFTQATDANQRADNYVLTTVLFALALFFGAVSTRFESLALQTTLLTVGAVVFLSAVALTASFPWNSDFRRRPARR
jgi:hypothetical protein